MVHKSDLTTKSTDKGFSPDKESPSNNRHKVSPNQEVSSFCLNSQGKKADNPINAVQHRPY